ncbi:hypothetical protein AVEN_82694-1 [Araneus ventricosus]|uniref:Uncharacterized protein n=1 Tax=Araneus ventricosus TaxID=182803 RepID=A0A4Y2R6X9_ARAVE|nr:hypothetical protein AVEN_82694-1 [Araneus ventricosus]
MGIDMKLAKREERVLLRVIEQDNRRVKAHHSSEIDGNFMDSSEESLGAEDISDQPGPSSNITQSPLEENINVQIELITGIAQKVIEDFISQKSLNLLKKLNIDISFLNISPDLWDRDDSYLKSQEIFQNLRVVNDTAERGIKLMQDFNGLLAVDEEQKQFLLQCVEDQRKQYSDCKKATLKRKFD